MYKCHLCGCTTPHSHKVWCIFNSEFIDVDSKKSKPDSMTKRAYDLGSPSSHREGKR